MKLLPDTRAYIDELKRLTDASQLLNLRRALNPDCKAAHQSAIDADRALLAAEPEDFAKSILFGCALLGMHSQPSENDEACKVLISMKQTADLIRRELGEPHRHASGRIH